MLTDRQCREAKSTGRAYKLSDAHSLYLHVSATGFRSWRWKYRFGGKEKLLVIGPYPSVSLKDARIVREESSGILRTGRDPGDRRIVPTESPTFETVARSWYQGQEPLWTPKYAKAVLSRLERDMFPAIGASAIDTLRPMDLRLVLTRIQERGAIEVAHKLRGHVDDIYVYAIANSFAEINPAAGLGKALLPMKKGQRPALIRLPQVQQFVLTLEAAPSHPLTKLASRLLALTAVRPACVQMARYDEFHDLGTDEPYWRIPAAKMKLGRAEKEREIFDFIVPLARQAVDVIEAARRLSGHTPWLFPSRRDQRKPISENALVYLYARAGFKDKHVPHGWRASFSTIMNERAAMLDNAGDRQVIDLMLAHQQVGVEPIYNRALYMPRRRALAQEWADMLLKDVSPPTALLNLPRR